MNVKANVTCVDSRGQPRCAMCKNKTERRAALRKAVALAKELHGKWEPDAFCNLGWHFAARRRKEDTVSPRATGGYLALLYYGGKQFAGEGETPNEAFHAARKAAQKLADKITAELNLY